MKVLQINDHGLVLLRNNNKMERMYARIKLGGWVSCVSGRGDGLCKLRVDFVGEGD